MDGFLKLAAITHHFITVQQAHGYTFKQTWKVTQGQDLFSQLNSQ